MRRVKGTSRSLRGEHYFLGMPPTYAGSLGSVNCPELVQRSDAIVQALFGRLCGRILERVGVCFSPAGAAVMFSGPTGVSVEVLRTSNPACGSGPRGLDFITLESTLLGSRWRKAPCSFSHAAT